MPRMTKLFKLRAMILNSNLRKANKRFSAIQDAREVTVHSSRTAASLVRVEFRHGITAARAGFRYTCELIYDR